MKTSTKIFGIIIPFVNLSYINNTRTIIVFHVGYVRDRNWSKRVQQKQTL